MISIPKKIIALLSDTPGELVLYPIIWERCWQQGKPYQYLLCINTLQVNIAYARKQLKSGKSGHIRCVRNYGYIYFESDWI